MSTTIGAIADQAKAHSDKVQAGVEIEGEQ
jgi:hypothetical protein